MKKIVYSLLSLGVLLAGIWAFSLSGTAKLEQQSENDERSERFPHPEVRDGRVMPPLSKSETAEIVRMLKNRWPGIVSFVSSSQALGARREKVCAILRETEVVFREFVFEHSASWTHSIPQSLKIYFDHYLREEPHTPSNVLALLLNSRNYTYSSAPDTCIETEKCFYVWHHGRLTQGAMIRKSDLMMYRWFINSQNLDVLFED